MEWNDDDDDDYDKGKIHHIQYNSFYVEREEVKCICVCVCVRQIERIVQRREANQHEMSIFCLFVCVCACVNVCWAGICVRCHIGLSHQRYQQTHIQCNSVAFQVSHKFSSLPLLSLYLSLFSPFFFSVLNRASAYGSHSLFRQLFTINMFCCCCRCVRVCVRLNHVLTVWCAMHWYWCWCWRWWFSQFVINFFLLRSSPSLHLSISSFHRIFMNTRIFPIKQYIWDRVQALNTLGSAYTQQSIAIQDAWSWNINCRLECSTTVMLRNRLQIRADVFFLLLHPFIRFMLPRSLSLSFAFSLWLLCACVCV